MFSNSYCKVAFFIVFFLLLSVAKTSEASVCVGVKEGDWIEYEVSTTGAPPSEFNVSWARMQIISVNGSEISAKVTTEASNGSLSSLVMTFNLEKGQIGAWFIIPAGLNPSDSFHDESRGCNVTVEGEEQLAYAGATRTVINAKTSERIKHWDKTTGVFVLCIDTFETYTINATAIRTNMWDAKKQEATPSLEVLLVLSSLISIIIVVAVAKRRGLKS